ncbi:transmembrane protein 200A [Tamandua tetradactyla]|uniref:transmembrane protein 200A n=1 Tax=Tamandua tetradactyla TaxID=48850 RepID=UPI0040547DCE
MIATGGVITGLAALKRQDSARSQQRVAPGPAPSAQDRTAGRRRPRADVVVVRGRIRLYSPAGFFLALGVFVSIAGVAMAVLGYWPHRDHFVDAGTALSTNATRVTRSQAGALGRFLEQHLHSDQMKMLGPFTMGIGIFIFICANAILHENRDKETRVIHMRDIYSTVIDVHALRGQEQKPARGVYAGPGAEAEAKRNGGACASRLAANPGASLAGFRSSFRTDSSVEEEEFTRSESKSLGQLRPPLLSDSSVSVFGLYPPPSRSAEDRNSGPKKCETKSIVSSSISAFTLPVIKLNNCVIDEPGIDRITEDAGNLKSTSRNLSVDSLVVPLPRPGDAFQPAGSMLPRNSSVGESLANQCKAPAALGPGPGQFLSPGAARRQFGSNTSLHLLSAHSKSLDLERSPSTLTVQAEQRKHPSWPRLDRSNSKGYTKLENREDPADRLLVPQVALKKEFTNKEKLLMISRSHNNLSFEHDEFLSNNLKRGTSETRF